MGACRKMRSEKYSPWLMMGLGLCWASEEMVSFCISDAFGSLVGGPSYLYVAYLPAFSIFGLALVVSTRIEHVLATAAGRTALLLAGALGVLLIAVCPDSPVVVILGVMLFAAGAICLNLLWFEVLARVSSALATCAMVSTAVVTGISTLFWDVVESVALLVAFLLFAASFMMCARYANREEEAQPVPQLEARRKPALRRAAIAGVCVLTTSFGFLQYTVYQYAAGPMPFGESIAHGISIALLVVVAYVVKDAEHTFAAKLATTLMLFSFVALSVFGDAVGLSSVLAAGTEGMLELVLFFALAEFSSYSGRSPARLFGWFTLVVGSTQLAGCLLSMCEHVVLPSHSYSVVGLVLVALLIVTSVWLLNDKTVTAFLWGDAVAEDELRRDGAATFEERASGVATAHGLTARETEVLLLFGKGRSSSFIAESFCVSNNTIRSHILHLYAKCGVHSRQELITLIDEWE